MQKGARLKHVIAARNSDTEKLPALHKLKRILFLLRY